MDEGWSALVGRLFRDASWFKAYSTQARRGIAQRPTDLVLRDPRSRRGPLHTKRVPIADTEPIEAWTQPCTNELFFFSALLTRQNTSIIQRCACIQVVEVTISGR